MMHGASLMPEMKREERVRVLLADDHVTVRYGLKLLIDAERDMVVVAEAGDGDEALRKAREANPDVVVMDISMPGMNGLAATRALKQAQPGIHVITLTRHTDDAYLHELLRAGASGYVLKRSAPTELLHAIRGVAAGGQYVDSTLTSRVTAGFITRQNGGARKQAPALTEREAQVLRLIAAGYGNKEIGVQLTLSAKTVDSHKTNAMRKLDLRGRIDIVKYAVLQGWLDQT
jgi:DNA-binding NarL/FixJ family response regulator